MNIVFFSSSIFIIPIIEDILKNKNLPLLEIFKIQYNGLNSLSNVFGKQLNPEIWNKNDLLEKMDKLIVENIKLKTKLSEKINLHGIVSQSVKIHKNKEVLNPIHSFCKKNNIKILCPEKLNASVLDLNNFIGKESFDLGILASYGQIISSEILEIPKYGFLNWHPSQLPKYRGATPMQTTLLNGDRETGLSWLEMTKKMDAGDIWLQIPVKISPECDITDLINEMGTLGAKTWALPIVAKVINQMKENK